MQDTDTYTGMLGVIWNTGKCKNLFSKGDISGSIEVTSFVVGEVWNQLLDDQDMVQPRGCDREMDKILNNAAKETKTSGPM